MKKITVFIINFLKPILALRISYPFFHLKKNTIHYFKSDTQFAIEKTFIKLEWHVENAFFVWISGIGFIRNYNGFKIVSPKRNKTKYRIISWGIGGLKSKSLYIKVIALNPIRFEIQMKNFSNAIKNNSSSSPRIKTWSSNIKENIMEIVVEKISPRFAEYNTEKISGKLELIRECKNHIELNNLNHHE
ncbi:MAG: hypothetical protein K1X55_17590 [Chitinophagales bacterium]|nr:hypothetical protein [Chitinophagales bacterium]